MSLSVKNDYASPRWSGEILDCSMPMTLDTYSTCSFRCAYCFAFFQKALAGSKDSYLTGNVRSVNVDKVKSHFLKPETSMFGRYTRSRIVMQWGGLSDPLDEYERRLGVSLELLRFFRELEYPVRICTKGTWWTEDERYTELLRGAKHFNLMFSIITADADVAAQVERFAPSPQERLRAIERVSRLGCGGVTLRLRPFIPGISDKTYLELIRSAASAGVSAVSTEFLCWETRSRLSWRRLSFMSKYAGQDLISLYRTKSQSKAGYMRLNRDAKMPFFLAMRDLCHELGLRFFVSDAHGKELCDGGSCCGLSDSWNYQRGQFTNALLLAKANGAVRWSDIEANLGWAGFSVIDAEGFNTVSAEWRAKFRGLTMKDWMRWHWNSVRSGKGPYKYFGGVLKPSGRDENGDIIYQYVGEK